MCDILEQMDQGGFSLLQAGPLKIKFVGPLKNILKGTVSRDFLYPVFFTNQLLLVPLEMFPRAVLI